MTRSRRSSVAFALLAALASPLAASRADADAARATPVAVTSIDGELRFAIEDELGHVRDVRVVPENRAAFRLRGTVRSFDATTQGASEHVACVVSVLVEDRRTGAMRAVLEGRARSEGPRGSVERESLLRAAVHGALRPIASTLSAR